MKLVEQNQKQEFVDFFKRSCEKETANIALCGGRSIVPYLKEVLNQEPNLRHTSFYLADERCVSPDDEMSNFKVLNNNFFRLMIVGNLISKENLHPFLYDEVNESTSLGFYNKKYKEIGNYDLVVLSCGEDGHFASIFPNSFLFGFDSEGYIYIEDSPKPPAKRMTLSLKSILDSSAIVLFFSGEGKKQAYEKFNDIVTKEEDLPVKALKRHKNLLVIKDFEE